MEARQISAFRCIVVWGLVSVAWVVATPASHAASYRTPHFIVSAPTAEYAREVGETAERLRRELAEEWLGRELPPWRDICPIEVVPANGAGGVTQFYFDRGQPHGWTMRVQGSRERVLDSVLPHEITHTVFATHFGRPLPRWADEGACTTTEDVSERRKQEKLLNDFLRTNRGIPFNRMFEMTEYPSDVLPLYAQGYSLARFLIALEGKPRFVTFVGEGLKTKNWAGAIQRNYGFRDLSDLQVRWNRWVAKGADERIAAHFGPEKPGNAPAAIASAAPNAALAATTVPPSPIAPVSLTGRQLDALPTIPDTVTSLPASMNAAVAATPLPSLPVSVESSGTLSRTASPLNVNSQDAGYYVRRRDEHRLAHPELMAARNGQAEKPSRVRGAGTTTGASPHLPSTMSSGAPIHAARPQPPQPAQQVIIEWSRPASQTFLR